VAVDIGTTTLRLLLIRLSDGVIVGEAGAQNPQIGRSGGGRDADPGGICGYLLAGNVAMA
jgi:sugar (pentulose or hexulose) kinase